MEWYRCNPRVVHIPRSRDAPSWKLFFSDGNLDSQELVNSQISIRSSCWFASYCLDSSSAQHSYGHRRSHPRSPLSWSDILAPLIILHEMMIWKQEAKWVHALASQRIGCLVPSRWQLTAHAARSSTTTFSKIACKFRVSCKKIDTCRKPIMAMVLRSWCNCPYTSSLLLLPPWCADCNIVLSSCW